MEQVKSVLVKGSMCLILGVAFVLPYLPRAAAPQALASIGGEACCEYTDTEALCSLQPNCGGTAFTRCVSVPPMPGKNKNWCCLGQGVLGCTGVNCRINIDTIGWCSSSECEEEEES